MATGSCRKRRWKSIRARADTRCCDAEGLKVISGFGVEDLATVELVHWKRLGGSAAYCHLEGSQALAEECQKSGVSLAELRSRSRRGGLPAVRTRIVEKLVENHGVRVAEIARQVGISTPGLEDPVKKFVHLVNSVLAGHLIRPLLIPRLGEIISFVNMVARSVIEWQFMKRRTNYDSR